MKRALLTCLIFLVFFSNVLGVYAKDLMITYDGSVHKYTGTICSIRVNDQLVESDIPPIIINNRSLVPVRAIFEKLGAKVAWDAANKKASIAFKDTNVDLRINDSYALVNGGKVKMEVPAKIINDRTMVPLRFVGEQLNMKVDWDAEKSEIIINSNEQLEMANLNKIDYKKNNNEDQVTINLDKYSHYKVMRLNEQDKIVIDFPNTKVASLQQNINVNSSIVKSVRCGQFDTETARVVLDVMGQPQYRLSENNSNLVVNLKQDLENQKDSTIEGKPDSIENSPSEVDIKYIVRSSYEEIAIRSKNIENYSSFLLTDPDRIVLDIDNAKAPLSQETIEVKGKIINSIRYAQNEDNRARVVVDVKTKPFYKVVKQQGQLLVYISNTGEFPKEDTQLANRGDEVKEPQQPNKLDVKYNANGQYEEVQMILKNYADYNITKNIDYNRIIIDLPGAIAQEDEKKIDTKSDLVKFISFAGINKNSARVIIELNDKSQYQVVEKEGKLVLQLSKYDGKSFDENNVDKEEPKQEEPEKEEQEQNEQEQNEQEGIEPEEDENTNDGTISNPGKEEQNQVSLSENILNVEHEDQSGFEKVVLSLKDYSGYSIYKLSDPDRIVIDIPNTTVTQTSKIDVNSSLIDSIRYSQYEKGVARIVIDVTGQTSYETKKLKESLEIHISKATYKNIVYKNNGDRINFILDGAKLTEGGENIKRLYKESYDLEGKQYTITFPSSLANIGTGIMNIDDSVVEYVKIIRDEQTKETRMVFNTKSAYTYEVNTRTYVNNTAITLLKRASKGDKLVVIDPGHGGPEPGAVYAGVNEKDLNLDIAKRLNQLLKKNNVKTYMIREDDSYVGLYERAYIANSLNSTLFLSIHNNAYHSKFKGTETLYYPQKANDTSFNGKRFAEIIQNKLVNTLKTTNRKIIERPNLVVLKSTKMDAALAEIAFMTNSEDMAKLKTEEFRQKAAEALCESILQALKEVD